MNHENKTVAFHRHFRAQRALGKSKTLSLETAKREHWDDYKIFVDCQNRGELLQSLEAPNVGRVMSIVSSGKLP